MLKLVSVTLPTLFLFNIVLANLGLLPLHTHIGGTVVKNPPASAGDARDSDSVPGWGRSPGEGNGYPLQYSCLENSTDRGARWTAVHGVAELDTVSH